MRTSSADGLPTKAVLLMRQMRGMDKAVLNGLIRIKMGGRIVIMSKKTRKKPQHTENHTEISDIMSHILIHILPSGGTLLSHNHSNEAV